MSDMTPEEMSLEKLLNKWDDEDGYASARSAGNEMAHRLRLLGERHHPDVTQAMVPDYPGGVSFVPCKCGRLHCPDTEILGCNGPQEGR